MKEKKISFAIEIIQINQIFSVLNEIKVFSMMKNVNLKNEKSSKLIKTSGQFYKKRKE